MNREEAKEKYISTELCPAQCNFIIDALFDDIESRTCENCIEYNEKTETCTHIEYTGCGEDKDFGCNRFERKVDVV